MVTIHPFDYSEQSYRAIVAIQNQIFPDQLETVEWWQHRDSIRNKEYFYQAFTVERDGQFVGYAHVMETPWSYRPGKYSLGVTVHPDYQRRGIGTQVYDHMLALLATRPQPPTLLIANIREDKTEAVRFLTKRGFQQVMRSPISRLELATFDGSRFADVPAKVEASGIRIYPMTALAQIDADYREKIYELDWQCTLDEPLPDAPTKPTFEDYCKFFFNSPNFMPEGCFIAVDQGEYVGMSNLFHNPALPSEINTGFTAVLRTHRRRGIATALKVQAIAYAQAQGYAAIKTGNEENNPMLAINLMLGFVPQPAWLDMQKVLP